MAQQEDQFEFFDQMVQRPRRGKRKGNRFGGDHRGRPKHVQMKWRQLDRMTKAELRNGECE